MGDTTQDIPFENSFPIFVQKYTLDPKKGLYCVSLIKFFKILKACNTFFGKDKCNIFFLTQKYNYFNIDKEIIEIIILFFNKIQGKILNLKLKSKLRSQYCKQSC